MRSLHIASFVTAALLVLGGARPAIAGLCAGTEAAPALCPPGPGDCLIATACDVPAGMYVDLMAQGNRRLVIGNTLTVRAPGTLTVKANGIVIQGSGKILAKGAGGQAIRLTSDTAVGITMAAGTRIDVSDTRDGGEITLDSAGPVTLSGFLKAVGAAGLDGGGYVSIFAQGPVLIAGPDGIVANGGSDAFGGDIDISSVSASGSGAPIIASAPMKVQGGDGGAIAFTAEGDVTLSGAALDVNAILAGGYAGEVDVTGVNVAMGNAAGETTRIVGTGQEDNEVGEAAGTGGDGAAVSVTASGSAFINADFLIDGAPSGVGGDFEVDAIGNITVIGKVLTRGAGRFGSGSEFVLLASEEGDVTVGARIDASGGQFGGSMDVYSNKQNGGKVTVTGPAQLAVDTLGPLPATELVGGAINLDACDVAVAAGAALAAKGPADSRAASLSSNVLRARTRLEVAGSLTAGSQNRLEYRDANIVSVKTGATLSPAARIERNATLSCCGTACVVPTTTTLPPTTTTTLPGTTTTTLGGTTTTTTTSTTSTSTAATTSTTVTETTSTSTTSIEPTTSTTPSTAGTTTTTTTTDVPPLETTSTTVPVAPSCSDQPTPFDAAACEIGQLAQEVDGATTDQLGGTRTAKRLRAYLRRADRFLDAAESGKRVDANLRRAAKQLKAFERAVTKGANRKRRPIDSELAASILSLSTAAKSGIALLQ